MILAWHRIAVCAPVDPAGNPAAFVMTRKSDGAGGVMLSF